MALMFRITFGVSQIHQDGSYAEIYGVYLRDALQVLSDNCDELLIAKSMSDEAISCATRCFVVNRTIQVTNQIHWIRTPHGGILPIWISIWNSDDTPKWAAELQGKADLHARFESAVEMARLMELSE